MKRSHPSLKQSPQLPCKVFVFSLLLFLNLVSIVFVQCPCRVVTCWSIFNLQMCLELKACSCQQRSRTSSKCQQCFLQCHFPQFLSALLFLKNILGGKFVLTSLIFLPVKGSKIQVTESWLPSCPDAFLRDHFAYVNGFLKWALWFEGSQ